MGKIFITSDLHLGHQNIIKYEPISRPFATVEEMDDAIVERWNSKVGPHDTVYVLGDLCMGMRDKVKERVSRLNGHIILVRGNHDDKNRIAIYEEMGIEVKDIAYLSYKGRYFVMCHFPIANEEFMKMVRNDNSEVVCLYGHVHHNAPAGFVDGTFHVGVDTNNLFPWSIEEIWQQCWPEEMMKKKVVKDYYEEHKNDKL